MLLSLVIIVALIWAAVIGNIYSNFLVFYSNFTETDNYNKAYYASIAALERAELVTKQRQPWFEWTWGRIDDMKIEGTDYQSDDPIETGFSYLSINDNRISSSKWHIDSLTNIIPKEWNGNVDRMLSTWDSPNFNAMDYNTSEVFLLYRDPGVNNPYKKLQKDGTLKCKESEIKWIIRLPGYLYKDFKNLNVNSWLLLRNEKNDAIVDRQVMWNYKNSQFTIFATQRTSNWNPLSEDTAIRESDLNDNGFEFHFRGNKNPKGGRDNRTIISPYSSEIQDFKQIFSEEQFSWNQIRFSLLNLLKNENWDIYPFLEYTIKADGDPIPDKYYTINSEWGYWDYLVNLTIIKPTIKESILKSFTTIF